MPIVSCKSIFPNRDRSGWIGVLSGESRASLRLKCSSGSRNFSCPFATWRHIISTTHYRCTYENLREGKCSKQAPGGFEVGGGVILRSHQVNPRDICIIEEVEDGGRMDLKSFRCLISTPPAFRGRLTVSQLRRCHCSSAKLCKPSKLSEVLLVRSPLV